MLFAAGEHALGRVPEKCLRMASVPAGGVGGSHKELCGALSGSVLIIGGLLGRLGPEGDDTPGLTLTARYRERFLAQFGVTQCAPLREWVKGPGGPGSCARLVEVAAAMLLDLLEETGRQAAGREPCREKC